MEADVEHEAARLGGLLFSNFGRGVVGKLPARGTCCRTAHPGLSRRWTVHGGSVCRREAQSRTRGANSRPRRHAGLVCRQLECK